jgi:hypothetical protein
MSPEEELTPTVFLLEQLFEFSIGVVFTGVGINCENRFKYNVMLRLTFLF